jgi:hypothetical protein
MLVLVLKNIRSLSLASGFVNQDLKGRGSVAHANLSRGPQQVGPSPFRVVSGSGPSFSQSEHSARTSTPSSRF